MKPDVVCTTEMLLFFRHLQFLRSDKMECRMEVRHADNQRMNRTSVFQVAYHRDGQVIKSPLRLFDRIEVEQRLRRVLIGAVTGIDDRYLRHFGSITGSPFKMVAHDDHISIIADHQNRVFKGLPFRRAGGRGVLKTDNTSSQTIHRRLETQTCTCRGFEKECGRDLTFKQAAVGIFFKLPGVLKNTQNIFFRTLINRY